MKKNDIFFRAISFLSAFLLFSIQPLIIKYLLPFFGGSSSTWIVGSLFFQGALLLGYVYALFLLKLPDKSKGLIHILFLAGTLTLGFLITKDWGVTILPPKNTVYPLVDAPIKGILTILPLAIGLPFLVLSTTNTILHWFYVQQFKKEPFFLYRISNTGSLLGLVSYPLLVEPFVSLKTQAALWQKGFILFALGMIGLSLFANIKSGKKINKIRKAKFSNKRPYGTWIFFAMVPVITMLSITNHLTQGISPVPFLWILPLSFYLISFIIGFSNRKNIYEYASLAAFPSSILLVMFRSLELTKSGSLFIQLGFYLIFLFSICLLCHTIIYRSRPQENGLGSFYLSITLGGFLGGLFVAVVAPLIFNSFLELDISIILGLFLSSYIIVQILSKTVNDPKFMKRLRTLIFVTGLICTLNVTIIGISSRHNTIYSTRNFYGVLTVNERNGMRLLTHGVILHGGQYLDESRKFQPTTYYLPGSGVAVAIKLEEDRNQSIKVGAVGLGTGTLATYCRENDQYDFYEINPEVVSIAKNYFSFLTHCGHLKIIEGDARIQFEKRGEDKKYDLIILDAFSDDAIPIHLLTKEAFEIYLRNLTKDGTLVIHISNRNLNLNPPLVRLAREFKLKFVNIPIDKNVKISNETSPSEWVLLSFKNSLLEDARTIRHDANDQTNFTEGDFWTDDYSSVFPLLNINPFGKLSIKQVISGKWYNQ